MKATRAVDRITDKFGSNLISGPDPCLLHTAYYLLSTVVSTLALSFLPATTAVYHLLSLDPALHCVIMFSVRTFLCSRTITSYQRRAGQTYGDVKAVQGVDSPSRRECFGSSAERRGQDTVMRIFLLPRHVRCGHVFGLDVRRTRQHQARLGVMRRRTTWTGPLGLREPDRLRPLFDIPKKESVPVANTLLSFVESGPGKRHQGPPAA